MAMLESMVRNYFSTQYGYSPTPLEISKAVNELPKYTITADFLTAVLREDGAVQKSRYTKGNSKGQFNVHDAFVTYVRTTSAAKNNRDPFISMFLLGVNLPNMLGDFAAGNASAEAVNPLQQEQGLEQELDAHGMSLQVAIGTLPSFLGTYELRFWKALRPHKRKAHRTFLKKAVEHTELGIRRGHATAVNISNAAEALFRLGWEMLEDKDIGYEERLKTAIELLSRSEAYVTRRLSLGKTGLHDFTSAAQVYLQLIRANYLTGATVQELDAYTTKFFDSCDKAISILANCYETKIAHIFEHLLEEIHKIVSTESQTNKQPQRLSELLRINASNLQGLFIAHERDRPRQALDSILRQTFLNT